MFKMLEKLINEHGSATILKERLGLKDDQIKAIQSEFISLTEENSRLKSVNMELKSSLERTQNELCKYTENIFDNGLNSKLNIEETNILKFLFGNNDKYTDKIISNFIETDVNTAKYHLNKLKDLGMINNILRSGGPMLYKISEKGIKYHIESKNT